MTNEEWNQVDEALDSFYKTVELDCDGYNLTLRLARISRFRNGIFFYVNGIFRGEWAVKDCEERRGFCRKTEGYQVVSAAATLKKIKSVDMHPDAKLARYWNIWTSFTAMKRHLIANNKEITLVKIS